jgi:hypothetical protein
METRDASTLPISLDTLSKGGDDLIGLPHPRQTWKGLLEGEAVQISVLSRAGVLDNYKGEAEAAALAGGGFDAVPGLARSITISQTSNPWPSLF